jgi:SAM-dependent methyltransferase
VELDSGQLQGLYAERFGGESVQRAKLWSVLCRQFFQRWVPVEATVLDVAAGHCEFINHIRAERRIAVDLNPDVVKCAGDAVETHVCRSDAMADIADGEIDVAFVSNFFEHISREAILATLIEIRRVLRPDGRLLILQPNIRFCARDYWQFFDHVTPVDDRALGEALVACGFDVVKNIPRFLPYTTKSRLPSGSGLVSLYLRVPLAWRVLGAQAFIVAAPAGGVAAADAAAQDESGGRRTGPAEVDVGDGEPGAGAGRS